jgi:hypothetical protein
VPVWVDLVSVLKDFIALVTVRDAEFASLKEVTKVNKRFADARGARFFKLVACCPLTQPKQRSWETP